MYRTNPFVVQRRRSDRLLHNVILTLPSEIARSSSFMYYVGRMQGGYKYT